MNKILIGAGFFLFLVSLAIVFMGDDRFLIPSCILGGSSLISYTIYSQK